MIGKGLNGRLENDASSHAALHLARIAFATYLILSLSSIPPALAAESGAPIPPERFSADYYKVYGTPNLTASLDMSRIYQGEATVLAMTLTNRGRITSFEINEEPAANKREEILAAQRELELEKQRTVAQDVSVLLRAENESAIDIKRSVAFPGNIREGQTSPRLEFPLEAFENALPGSYQLAALVNYTYQKDVAVKEDDDRPENPDVYYWYDSLSQTIPIDLIVERRSGAQFTVLNVTPASLRPGSEGNVVRIRVKNVGDDRASDLVARLRPESGLYVSVDESPIPSLEPQEEAELIYRLDVSKDALPGKNYQLKILFQFSDSRRDDLTDWENAYLRIEEGGREWALAILLFLALLAAVLILGGALSLISSLHRAVPIIHAGPGCGFTLTFGQNIANGYQYIGYASGFAAPSTNTLEKHVVFGGENRLREQIRTTLEIMDADLLVVVTGCTAGLIGDDVRSIVGEFEGSEKPVIFSETSGFKGNTYRGYDLALRSLVDQLVIPAEKKTPKLVNLFGVVPSQDAFWQGDINEIVRLLGRIGLKVNLSGNGDNIEKIRRAAEAELNIVLSEHTGQQTAELFREKYQVPYIKYSLPIGTETGKFLRAVAEVLDLERELVEKVIAEEEEEFWKYLIEFSEAYVFLLVNKEFGVISDSNYAIGLARFLSNDLGLFPKLIAITDSPDESLRPAIESRIRELNYNLSPKVIFEDDSYKIWEEITLDPPNLIFGSSIDRAPAKNQKALLFPVSYPLFDQTVLSKGYSGYRGAVRLVEDLGTALLTSI